MNIAVFRIRQDSGILHVLRDLAKGFQEFFQDRFVSRTEEQRGAAFRPEEGDILRDELFICCRDEHISDFLQRRRNVQSVEQRLLADLGQIKNLISRRRTAAFEDGHLDTVLFCFCKEVESHGKLNTALKNVRTPDELNRMAVENFIVDRGDVSGNNQPGVPGRSAIQDGFDIGVKEDSLASLDHVTEPNSRMLRFEQKEIQIGTINIFEDFKLENRFFIKNVHPQKRSEVIANRESCQDRRKRNSILDQSSDENSRVVFVEINLIQSQHIAEEDEIVLARYSRQQIRELVRFHRFDLRKHRRIG